jgi:hypothetical protein
MAGMRIHSASAGSAFTEFSTIICARRNRACIRSLRVSGRRGVQWLGLKSLTQRLSTRSVVVNLALPFKAGNTINVELLSSRSDDGYSIVADATKYSFWETRDPWLENHG